MKIPSFVRINGIDYPVERVKSLNDGTNIAHGYADFVHNRIQLNPDTQGYEHMCVTLWHEILHILINNAQIEVPDEEQLVRALSGGIYQVLQDNGRRLFDIVPVDEPAKKKRLEEETMTREEVLQAAAKCVNGNRQEDYGSPENNFGLVAAFWNAYLRPYMRPNIIGIDSKDVAAMLGLLKIARIATGRGKADNWIDLAGYAACGGELERAEEATRSEGDERT